ncbi:Vegetative incompatibility protein HET-E-1 [Colletotrichum gloeosporioides]|uniref:Vegetative incompatibility protein HET-E-1 n=1 Tax=Colletotrichum gloeosporioides TaxID=474922 RepID=A0A8H4CDX5_COLGL|nr:Vegetative incompatibility protein HET-E-1 [Colletotrichum gloeosporioides]KAF3802012.1 Vegetative incompatibility protein HET-E-1 [Colletotrichum gloeosporioides]
MWLINTRSLALEEISDPASVEYAILSHTWEDDEISFQDIRSPNADDARRKAGFSKVAKTCELARQRHIEFAWIDTCCIDKSSSAELSEAINSMFTWYKLSTVCFVFLSDLSPSKDSESQQTLGKCRWFSRGWTLQELIAPRHVEFYDSTWKRFSRKANIPVAVKMSWAAERQTKRIEDRAYSLLGIFDINMPMIYGEGHKSFRRLQEEIAKETGDLSLFAWRGPSAGAKGYQEYRGSFARNMTEFLTCSNM